MKKNMKMIPARFVKDIRFEVDIPNGRARGAVPDELEGLKNRLLIPFVNETARPLLRKRLRQAAQEAVSMAWLTPCPLLVLPLLVEEKVQEAQLQMKRQQEIRTRSRALLDLAA